MPIRLTDQERGPLGARLYHARLDAGLTQAEMAEKIGIRIGSYTKWEIGKTDRPDIGHLKKAADILEVSLPWLLTGERSINFDTLDALRVEMAGIRQQLRDLKDSLPQ